MALLTGESWLAKKFHEKRRHLWKFVLKSFRFFAHAFLPPDVLFGLIAFTPGLTFGI